MAGGKGNRAERIRRPGWRARRLVARLWRRRRTVLSLSALVLAVCATGLVRLHFSTDYRAFFDRDDPQLLELERMAENFGRDDNLLIVIEPHNGDMFTAERLRLLADVTDQAGRIPNAVRVDSLTNFLYIDNSDLVPEARLLVPKGASLTDEEAARIGAQARSEPLLAGHLVSRHTAAVGINISLDLPPDARGEDTRAVDAAREILYNLRANHPDLRVGLTGTTAINNAFGVATRQDLATLLPIMSVVLIVVMVLMLRSASGAALALAGVTASAAIAMGLAGWWSVPLTPSTGAAPTLILAVAIADSMHLLIGYFTARRAGAPRRPALIRSISEHGYPIFLTSLTTIIGFLALNFSESPPLRNLGSIAALGVACAWAYTMFVLPVLILMVPSGMGRAFRAAHRSLAGLAEFIIARRRAIAIMLIIALLSLGSQTFTLRINEEFYKDFSERVPVRVDTEFAIERLSGACLVMWMLDSGKPQGVHDPGFMARADGFVRWLERQKDVAHVTAATTLLRRLDAAVVVGTEPGEGVLPARADAIEAYLNIYADTAPQRRGLRHLVNPDRSALRIVAVLGEVDSRDLRGVTTSAESYLSANVPTATRPLPTGACSMFGELAHNNIRAMLKGTGAAFLLIALCLMGALVSFRLGLTSLVPNVLPPFVAFGAWALIRDEVGLAASVVTATSLGVIVDATVHILTHYRAARRAGNTPEEAITHSLARSGTAIWAGAFILIAGFAVLGLSSFRVTQDLGVLTAMTLAVATVVDFLLLPPLLLLTDRPARRRQSGR